MIQSSRIVVDPRKTGEIVTDLLERRAGYAPEWLPSDKGPDFAMMQIIGRYLYAMLQRLNQTPEKNRLAFLDLLNIQLIPSQSARVPVVFILSPQSTDIRLPAGTQLAAPPPPESTRQIVFETERSTGLAVGELKQVLSLWPGRDQYIDHAPLFLSNQPFTPFKKKELQDTPHIIYIAHDTLLALAGRVRLDVEFELIQHSSEPLDILWEYWDGKVWRGFKSMNPACGEEEGKLDGTSGLTRSGAYRLEADCAEASKTTLNKNSLRLTELSLENLESEGIPDDVLEKLANIKDQQITGEGNFLDLVKKTLGAQKTEQFKSTILNHVVRGFESYWVRGRLTEPIPPNPVQILPDVEGIRLSTEIANPLSFSWIHDRKPAEQGADFHVVKVRDHVGVPLRGIKVTKSSSVQEQDFTDMNGEHDVSVSSNAVSVSLAEFQSETIPLDASQEIEEITFTLTSKGLSLAKAFSDETALDISKPFYPLGLQPQPGSSFYFTNPEVFSKPGAKVKIYIQTAQSPSDQLGFSGNETLPHSLSWEYWNGRSWISLMSYSNRPEKPSPLDFSGTAIIEFRVPPDMSIIEVNAQEGPWMRVRLLSGGFGFKQTVQLVDSPDFSLIVPQPPALSSVLLGYTWQYGPFHPEKVLAYNDFQYQDHTDEAKWPGRAFQPFKPVGDVTPALYLGFDKKLPVDRLNLYFDIVERQGETEGPALTWEYWDGIAWKDFLVEDETRNLRIPGLLSFIGPEESRSLARFGTELYWLRGRLKEDGPPGEPILNGIFSNAVWAVQQQSIVDEPIGLSTGQPNLVFTFRQIPVLAGEHIEVRELSGARANVEWRIVAIEIFGGDSRVIRELEEMLGREGHQPDIQKGDLRLRRDRNKKVTEVWVCWQAKEHFFFSGPDDRHYILERARGRLKFGDGKRGKIPPLGGAVLARKYRTGGGITGNVSAGTVTQVLGGVGGIESVFNPKPAEGGADAETLEGLSLRGPKTLRHRGRALLAEDYETMAKEASPAVAFARAIPLRNMNGRKTAGWITLLIIPESDEPRPWPSFGLREHVRRFIEAHAPAGLADAHQIYVTGPEYLPVDVDVTVIPLDPAEAGSVEKRAREALETFLHPLRGGPNQNGWELGRDVYLSDVASVLEGVKGVDYVEELALLLHGALQRERVKIAEDRIVVVGEIRIKIKQG